MELSDGKKKEYIKRLMLARMTLLGSHGFYGLLLMHMGFALEPGLETAATDGDCIFFDPEFLDEISDSELQFILMHEVLHAALRHCDRTGERDPELFNIACDIVVNSNILAESNWDKRVITLKKYGESMHVAPDGTEGSSHTAEEVYEQLIKNGNAGNTSSALSRPAAGKGKGSPDKSGKKGGKGGSWDNHTHWGKGKGAADPELQKDVWEKRVRDAAEAVQRRIASTGRGSLPLCAERLLSELRRPQLDWRTILSSFVQEEITDYSFSPPDRRFSDSGFFLPDYSGKEEIASDILFMIDASGSMSDEMIAAAFSEVKGALEQFGGRLRGWLGFFDAAVSEPEEFGSIDQLMRITPKGGGGTSFSCIFRYVRDHMEKPPASIIILTDGYAPFPGESKAMGIPVLWLLNNHDVQPPWGMTARIKI